MSTRVVVVTNPSHDDPTRYLNFWWRLTISSLKAQFIGFDVYELKNDKVTKENLTKLVEKKNPGLILFHGHGGGKKIFGFKENILVACDDNEHLLQNKIIHSLTCDSGRDLGQKCVRIGTKAFIGYKKEFKFAYLSEKTDTLRSRDVLAGIFFRPAFEVDRALLEGNSIERAYIRSQQVYKDNLQMLLTSNKPKVNTEYASFLYHDLINQVALGDRNATF